MIERADADNDGEVTAEDFYNVRHHDLHDNGPQAVAEACSIAC